MDERSLRQIPGLALHPREQEGAWADQVVGRLDRTPLQEVALEKVAVIDRKQVARGEVHGRAVADDDEGRIGERQPLPLRVQRVKPDPLPLRKVDDIELAL